MRRPPSGDHPRGARTLTLLAALLAAGCPPDKVILPPAGPSISGRVVDLESCLTAAGCQGASGARVSFLHDASIVSEATHPDGAFALRPVPVGARDLLMVTDASGRLLPALQTVSVVSTGADVFGVELHALRREGGLFAAIAAEAGVDLSRNALYLGQVYQVEGAGMTATIGASVSTTPASTIRYVDCNPRIKEPPCTKALLDPLRTTTGPYGEFLAVAPGAGDLTVQVTVPGGTLEKVVAPVGIGYLTVGLHEVPASDRLDGGRRSDR